MQSKYTYLNLDKEMIARAPILGTKPNLKMTKNGLDRANVDCQCDSFKLNNILVYHILSKIFIDKEMYVYVKQRKRIHGQALFFNIHKCFLPLPCGQAGCKSRKKPTELTP